jgi:hypothetical protein
MIINDEFIAKQPPNKLLISQMQELISSKLHQCALVWSDRCAHCEIDFDGLKQKILATAEPNEEDLNELKKQIGDSLAKLEGLLCLF